ncbi:MCE family protein [Nocardia panacis]|uniref:MCE family protein n=1 Tax=Nocardia panacis TaxID=2340916 RepID=A0A3A4KRF4_9NOCA|nr:MCE family protein [Nocardia panacis]RJO78697.1 MCE family protein [Nocardia panacis]
MKLLSRMRPLPRWVALVAAAAVVAAVVAVAWQPVANLGKTKIQAYFPSTNALYVGDDVRVLGVKVGRITAVEPGRDKVRVDLLLDRGVSIPAAARAVIVSPSLVSARFIQLAPAYTGGPKLGGGGQIGLDRTAVPVEWDDIKSELARLAKTLGPVGDQQGSFGKFLDTAANNLDGNGQKLRDTIRELSATLNTLSDGRTDLFGSLRNLQKFVDVLSASNEQIVQFGGRLASVSAVLAGVSNELGSGLDNLDAAVSDVKRFLDTDGARLSEGVRKLGEVTQILVDKRPQLEQILHAGPTALENFYRIYQPSTGSLTGVLVGQNAADAFSFLCGSVESLKTNDSDRSASLCAEQLAPIINSLMINYPPILANPTGSVRAFPSQLQFSTPELAARAAAEAPPVIVPNGLAGLVNPGGDK